MIKNGVKLVAEAANMPCEQAAVDAFVNADVSFGPAKAVNAGGVGVSGRAARCQGSAMPTPRGQRLAVKDDARFHETAAIAVLASREQPRDGRAPGLRGRARPPRPRPGFWPAASRSGP